MPERHIEIRNLGNNDSRGPVYDLEPRQGMLPRQLWDVEVKRARAAGLVVGKEERLKVIDKRLRGIREKLLGNMTDWNWQLEKDWMTPINGTVKNEVDDDGWYYQILAALTKAASIANKISLQANGRNASWVVPSFLRECSATQVLEWMGLDLVEKSSGLRHRVRKSSTAIRKAMEGLRKGDTKPREGGGGGYEQLSNSLSHSDRRMSSRQIERVYGLTSRGLSSDGGHYF